MNVTNTTAVFPEVWVDLWRFTDEPLDFEAFLSSDLLAAHRDFMKIISSIFTVTGSLSVLCSGLLIYHILRSYACLSTTYNRLIFSMSIADIVGSLAHAMSARLSPAELDYVLPSASGTVASCDFQGYLAALGAMGTHFYSSALCFYYLAIVKYNKKDEFIAKKLEPWFHGISVVMAFFISTVFLLNSKYNYGQEGGACFATPSEPYIPPHCIGREYGETPFEFKIPCGRGDLADKPFPRTVTTAAYGMIVVLPIILSCTMFMMYSTVRKIERDRKKYGRGTLRIDHANAVRIQVQLGNSQTTPPIGPDDTQGCCKKFVRMLRRIIPCVPNEPEKKRKSHQKRAIVNMSMSYFLAWFLAVVPFIIAVAIPCKLTNIGVAVFTPLRGLFNLVVYMSQKIRNAKKKRRGPDLTWREATVKAWLSRGEKSRKIKTSRRNSIQLRSMSRKMKTQSILSSIKSSFSFGRNSSVAKNSRGNRNSSSTLKASALFDKGPAKDPAVDLDVEDHLQYDETTPKDILVERNPKGVTNGEDIEGIQEKARLVEFLPTAVEPNFDNEDHLHRQNSASITNSSVSILRASSLRSFGSGKNIASPAENLENFLPMNSVVKEEEEDETPKENTDEIGFAEGEASNLQVAADEGNEGTEDKANPLTL